MDIFSIIEDEVKPLGVGIDSSKVKAHLEPGKIIGREINSPADIADLMQEYRNPLYETGRIFYMREKKIAAVESFSSHIPSITKFGTGTIGELKQHISEHKDALNADGYYLLHNHPSGDPKPSLQDKWLTQGITSAEDGFLGHIVVDHTTFALINQNGQHEILNVPNHFEKDIFLKPTLEHPLLNKVIKGPEQVSEVGRKLIDYRNDISIGIFTAADGRIVAMTEFSNQIAESEDFLKLYSEKATLDYGAANAYILTTSDKAYEHRRMLVEKAYVRDMILTDEWGFFWSAHEENISKNGDVFFADKCKSELPVYTEYISENDLER